MKRRKNWSKIIFFTELAFVCIILAVALLAPWITPQDPLQTSLADKLLPASSEHWFGTDALGRDLFSRIIYGTRASVLATLGLVAIVFFIGTTMGVISGYFGGAVDTVIMRIADTMIAFPDLILAIAVVGILGPSLSNAMIAIAVVSWTKYARLARSLVMKIRKRDYLTAATMTGSRLPHIFHAYLTPNILPTMVITATMDIGTTMLSLASLSFLGFGIQPPTPEWGYMLSESRQYFQSAPWLLLYPGFAILIVVIAFNLLGDSLRDILDPRGNTQVEDTSTSMSISA